MNTTENLPNNPTTQAIEIAIRLGVIFLILSWCLVILSPFISIVAWGAIIATSIYKPFIKLVDKLGGRKKLALTLITVISIAAILVPVILLSSSMVESGRSIGTNIIAGTAQISPPAESVRDWPLIGERAYTFWSEASTDLSALLQKHQNQLAVAGKKLLSATAGIGAGILQFIISMLIAAAFLAGAKSAGRNMHKLATRLSPAQGEALLTMSTNTVRSVAIGVIGIAFIQAVLGGLGMMAVGIPMAGLLALVIFILGIAQLPPLLVLLPAIIYVFSGDSTMVAVIFMIWSLLVSFSDMALKPLLLGRGVDAPMMVILLGAIGGMITSGIVGLFIGAVVLALGYKLFQAWIAMANTDSSSTEADSLLSR